MIVAEPRPAARRSPGATPAARIFHATPARIVGPSSSTLAPQPRRHSATATSAAPSARLLSPTASSRLKQVELQPQDRQPQLAARAPTARRRVPPLRLGDLDKSGVPRSRDREASVQSCTMLPATISQRAQQALRSTADLSARPTSAPHDVMPTVAEALLQSHKQCLEALAQFREDTMKMYQHDRVYTGAKDSSPSPPLRHSLGSPTARICPPPCVRIHHVLQL